MSGRSLLGIDAVGISSCREGARGETEVASHKGSGDVKHQSFCCLFGLINNLPHPSHNKMAFLMRRPFAVASALKQTPITSTAFRAFHQGPIRKAPSPSSFSSKFASSRATFRSAFQNSFRRNYQQPAAFPNPTASGNLTQRLIYGGAIFGGTLLAIK